MTNKADFASGAEVPDPPLALGQLIWRFEVGVRTGKEEHLRAFRITAGQYAVLTVLARTDGVSTADMARYFRVTPQAMSQLLAGLERRGLVTRRPDPQHRKIMRLSLTAAGRRLQRSCEAVTTQAEDAILQALSPEERRTLLTLLWKACDALGVMDRPTGWPEGRVRRRTPARATANASSDPAEQQEPCVSSNSGNPS
jgi:DNA-binding MarR family transcriptional regulator